MGTPSFMRSVVDRNVVLRLIPVLFLKNKHFVLSRSVQGRLTTGMRSEKCVVRAISSLCERHRVYSQKPRQYSIDYTIITNLMH